MPGDQPSKTAEEATETPAEEAKRETPRNSSDLYANGAWVGGVFVQRTQPRP